MHGMRGGGGGDPHWANSNLGGMSYVHDTDTDGYNSVLSDALASDKPDPPPR